MDLKKTVQIYRLFAFYEARLPLDEPADLGLVTVEFGRLSGLFLRSVDDPMVVHWLFNCEITLIGCGIHAEGCTDFAHESIIRDEHGIERTWVDRRSGWRQEWLLVPEGTRDGCGGDLQGYGQGRVPILSRFFGKALSTS